MSACTVENAALVTEYVYIDEYTVVNFTANDFAILFDNGYDNSAGPATMLTPMMLIPCIFQYYTSNNDYLDTKYQTESKLNYTTFFINNNIDLLSTYKYSITYCGWAEESAFLHIRASLVNKMLFNMLMILLSMIKLKKRSVSVITKTSQIMIAIVKILVLIIQVKLLHYILSQCGCLLYYRNYL